MTGTQTGDRPACSFCGVQAVRGVRLLAGPQVYICRDCVTACNQILRADRSAPTPRR